MTRYLYEVAENGDCMILTEDGEGIATVHSEVIAQQMVDELNTEAA